MRPQASLRRSETSRRKIQSRFSVFTTSSQTRILRHQWTQVPNNCDKHAVISVPMVTYLRNIWWVKSHQRDPPQKQRLMDLNTNDEASGTDLTSSNDYQKQPYLSNRKANRSKTLWSVKHHKRPRQKILMTQTVRATASSPSDKRQVSSQNTQQRDPPQKPKSDGSQQRAFTSENSDETQQSMSLMKTPGRWSNNKELTASKDHTPNCWIRQYATSETNGWTHQSKVWQQHQKGSIWCTSIQTKCCSATRSTSETKSDGSQQQQLTALINHLKEEPSALQSLSIFDST